MADIPCDGNVRVVWMTSPPANKNAPTVAELTAGLLLTSALASDGLAGWQPDTDRVQAPKLDSTFTATGVGSMVGFIYTIDQANTRATTSTGAWGKSSTTCWISKKSGEC